MTKPYPGLHKAVGRFISQYISISMAYIPLTVIFGLPAIVIAFAASYYHPTIPDYSAGYVFIALIAIMMSLISKAVDGTSGNDIDRTELNQSQINILFVVLTISTVLSIGSVVLVAGAIATLVQLYLGLGYVAASVAAGFVFVDEWLSKVDSHYSVGSWAFLAGLEISHAYFTMRYNSDDHFDDEIEQSAKRGGPIL